MLLVRNLFSWPTVRSCLPNHKELIADNSENGKEQALRPSLVAKGHYMPFQLYIGWVFSRFCVVLAKKTTLCLGCLILTSCYVCQPFYSSPPPQICLSSLCLNLISHSCPRGIFVLLISALAVLVQHMESQGGVFSLPQALHRCLWKGRKPTEQRHSVKCKYCM